MRKVETKRIATNIFACVLMLSACASTPKVVKVYEDADGMAYKKILVVGIAKNYDRRAEFERALVSRLSSRNVAASAYYTIGGGNQPVRNADVSNAVTTQGFDAILLTRILSQDTDVAVQNGMSSATATRRDDGPIDFFRYDYDVLDDPKTFRVTNSGVLLSELYSAGDEKKVWAIQSIVTAEENVSAIINDVTDSIVGQLVKDGLIN